LAGGRSLLSREIIEGMLIEAVARRRTGRAPAARSSLCWACSPNVLNTTWVKTAPARFWFVLKGKNLPVFGKTLPFPGRSMIAPAVRRPLPGTLIKSKNPWNDQAENASQSKVTRWCHAPSLGSGPSHTTTQQPGWGRATAFTSPNIMPPSRHIGEKSKMPSALPSCLSMIEGERMRRRDLRSDRLMTP
jgi:hypothetical protein